MLFLCLRCCYVFRSICPSQPEQSVCHQRDSGRGRPGDSSSQLDIARGARYPHTSLQSILELDRAHQVHGAIQEEKEKDHQWGNLLTLSEWCVFFFLSFLYPVSKTTRALPRLFQHLFSQFRYNSANMLGPAVGEKINMESEWYLFICVGKITYPQSDTISSWLF